MAGAGHNETFKISSDDFPAILDNIHGFEKLIPREWDYETISITHKSLGHRSIKLTHSNIGFNYANYIFSYDFTVKCRSVFPIVS